MIRRVGTGGRATRKPVVVIAGEDGNDRKSLRILLEAGCPDMRGRLVEIKDSVRLRQATGATLKQRVSVLVGKARARAERENAQLACVFVHEDWDDLDSSQREATRTRVQQALDGSVDRSHYVLVAWEIESWLMLFPAALSGEVSSWVLPARYRGRDTGTLADPKRILKSECGQGSRRYTVADAPTVMQRAVDLGLPIVGSNLSWTGFQQDMATCCSRHLVPPRRR